MHILSHLPLARRYGRRYGMNSRSSQIAQLHTYQLGVLVFSFLLVDSLRCHPPFLQNVYLPTSNKTNKEQVAHNTILTTVTVDANRTGLNWEAPSPSLESSRYCDELPGSPSQGAVGVSACGCDKEMQLPECVLISYYLHLFPVFNLQYLSINPSKQLNKVSWPNLSPPSLMSVWRCGGGGEGRRIYRMTDSRLKNKRTPWITFTFLHSSNASVGGSNSCGAVEKS